MLNCNFFRILRYLKTIKVMSTEKYTIYFEGDKVKTVYGKSAVNLWKSIADKMGFSFKVE